MEFYEQGVLLFETAKKFSSFLFGVNNDMYIASADAFIQAHINLKDIDKDISERSYLAAFYLYRHCVNNIPKNSKLWTDVYDKFKSI
jgi:hypothetical protein